MPFSYKDKVLIKKVYVNKRLWFLKVKNVVQLNIQILQANAGTDLELANQFASKQAVRWQI